MIFDLTKRTGGGGGTDVIYGTATAVGTSITLPIPDGYYYHAYLASAREIVNGDLQIVHATPYGLFRRKVVPAVGTMERLTTEPFPKQFWITYAKDSITFTGNNPNTSGVIYDGDTWAYVAWKAAT